MTDVQTLLAGMVRPLEFNDRNCADVYSVKEGYGQTPKAFFMARGSLIIGHYDTANEAEAAAQADHIVRILAALDLDTLATGATSALVGDDEDPDAEYVDKATAWDTLVAKTRRKNEEAADLVKAAYDAALKVVEDEIDQAKQFGPMHVPVLRAVATTIRKLRDAQAPKTADGPGGAQQ